MQQGAVHGLDQFIAADASGDAQFMDDQECPVQRRQAFRTSRHAVITGMAARINAVSGLSSPALT